MSYQALYRLWRPQQFQDVVGQEHITKTLQNALLEANYSHAYLFNGPRGTGKTSTAKILAKAVNCEKAPAPEPCNACRTCQGITNGTVVDVVEIDAASNNGVDEIRELRDKVRFSPTEARVKVYIIDEVHMLSQGAFNALLKTLEEPPAHVMFILATTEPHKIPLTIISRCQRFDFRRISKSAIADQLQWVCEQEDIVAEPQAVQLLAQVAEGGMRDALSLLDQAESYAVEEVTLEDVLAVTGAVSQEALSDLADAMLAGQLDHALTSLHRLLDQGKEPVRLVEDLIYYFRDLLLYQTAPGLEDMLERVQVTEDLKRKAETYSPEQISQGIEKLSAVQQEMKWSNHPRVYLEVICIQLAGLEAGEDRRQVQADTRPSNVTSASGQIAEHTSTNQAGIAPTGQQTEEVRALQSKVSELEQALTSIRKAIQSGQKAADETDASKPTKKSVPPPMSRQRLIELLKTASKSHLHRLGENWSQILEQVKKKKIVLKALLDDCEPVACGDTFFLLSFKNEFHRNTTEDPDNREMIEEVVANLLQSPVKMVTIMYNEWDEVKEQFIREQAGEKDNPSPPPHPEHQQNQQNDQEHHEEAVRLFGDLVELVDGEDSQHKKEDNES
ncbi:DNA polymerase III subunit gamma/tau [Caldalkalibacillus salinus]|uniref:DNA polymerase III subunit gamma/tau n=1 Tax=Caldalkalibacillus salinus TaxID=2803787 RepID=UPI0019246302|nr:DNA polymerase III subunit gamma/tau [Caldalkalibacillus salinus]